MNKNLLLAGIFLIGLVITMIWMEGGFHSKIPAGETPLKTSEVFQGDVFEIKPLQIAGEVTVSGSVVSREGAKISARISGNILEVLFEAGDTVTKNQELIKIESKEAQEREAQAKAALESASADRLKAERDLERFRPLLEKQAISKKEFDDTTARYEVASAKEEQAKAALSEAGTVLSYSVVRAPFDGMVSEKFVNPGDLVVTGKPLLSMYTAGSSELAVPVGEQYAPFLKVGAAVKVKLPSIDLDQESSIREIVPQRDERTRTIMVKAPLKDVQGLVPGLYGTLTFMTGLSQIIQIPKTALSVVGQLETVRVLENGKIQVRYVKTGRSMNDKIEVLSGLNPGEKVVSSSQKEN